MKIAFLNIYQDKVARGAETFVHELARRLSKNHTVDVISDVKYSKLLSSKYDIIVPTNGRFQVFLTRIITWLTGGKMVISGQSGPGLDDRLNLYAFPNYFVALTNYQRKWAKKVNPLVKIASIPNGVDINKFQIKGPSIKVNLASPIILSVAALESGKRLDLAIKAVSKLKSGSLLIVGKGKEEERLKELGKRLLPGRFEILSFPHKDMPKVYSSVDLFTFPTVTWESFGIVLVEAMASGLPVVATDDPIRKEVVGEAGLLVDPEDTVSYAKALEKALEINWGDKPRKQAEKFSWDRIAKEYERLFTSLVK